jgi:small subunit ribosomal protein S6
MINYETIFVIDTQVGEEQTQVLVEKFKGMLETSATLESIDKWGKKKLAYPIDFKTEGYYVLANFKSEPSFPKELERIYKITDGIIKYIVIKKD